MSDRREDRKTNREATEAPGARHDAPEEYTGYRETDPSQRKPREAEAVREAELQPGGGEETGGEGGSREGGEGE